MAVVERLYQIFTGFEPTYVVELFSAVLTPIIAITTVFIAYQQWRTNKTRLDLELYNRRLTIYKALDAFYADIAVHGTAKYPMVFDLRHATVEAAFLFPTDIEKHLMEVYEKGLRAAERMLGSRYLKYWSTSLPPLPLARLESV